MNTNDYELKFTKTHEWILVNNDEATIGISDHAQKQLGDLVYIDLPEIGAQITAGDELGVVESVKAASDFYSPISGVVIEINNKASEDPAIVNRSPQDSGWLVKIKINDPYELEELMTNSEYLSNIDEE